MSPRIHTSEMPGFGYGTLPGAEYCYGLLSWHAEDVRNVAYLWLSIHVPPLLNNCLVYFIYNCSFNLILIKKGILIQC